MAEANQLDFEQPILEIEREIERLRILVESGDLSKAAEVEKLERKLRKARSEIFSNLTPYERVKLSRHFTRPFTLDYIERLMTDFVELHGDRLYADDSAIVGGFARFSGISVMVIGHQRGRSTQDRIRRNFGMTLPEGNRKAQRLFKLAEKFHLPLVLFIDTPGAHPGLDAEARGQAEAIARSIYILAGLRTPIISAVIGEGGSGGALALGVCDRLLMLENSTYSVITPEGCASILWGKRDADSVGEYAAAAAASLKLTARSLEETGIVDEIVKEPAGGAHKDPDRAAEFLGESLARHLSELTSLEIDELLDLRYAKYKKVGLYD